jgi:hypothetical protein
MINIFLNGDKLRSTFTLVIGACLNLEITLPSKIKPFKISHICSNSYLLYERAK